MNDETQTTDEVTLKDITWRDYYNLCKPKVVMLIVFTAVVGMLLAVPGAVPWSLFPWQPFIFGTIGIGLAAGSAAAINQVVDQRIDAQMARTKNRPLPTGHMDSKRALAFAFAIGAVAMIILVVFVNELTAILTFASLIGYAVVYTMYLKYATPQNIVIGGAAGAAPPVLGWTAITGDINAHSLLLFLIIFAWTPPHFWALAIHRCKEYAKVDVPMLPVTHGLEFTRLQILLYTIILIVVTILPFVTLMSGVFYLAGAIALGLGFLYYSLEVKKAEDETMPIKTFGYSIFYLMALFAFLLIDHYIPY
ncbi:MAG: heme o synthase [Sulfuriflexus sp.]|nr:heme o synthase [Sulfuriflexus sp.]